METSNQGTQYSSCTPEMFTQQWPHLRQQVKTWWDQLTDADLDQVAGDKERLIRAIQGRYGYAHERAEQEVDRRLREVHDASGSSKLGRMAEVATSSAQELASEATKRASDVGTRAQKLASSAAGKVSDAVTQAGQYLPEVPSGLAGLIRRYPMPALMVGMGLGLLLGRGLGWMGEADAGDERRPQPEAGYPNALIQCSRCGQMLRQVDMVHHSATCTGSGAPTTGGSTS